ncbi:MAG: RNA polymerase sigma factor [Bacillota bacterium]
MACSGSLAVDLPKGQDKWAVFESLVRQHEKRIYNFAYRLSGNRDDAQDLTQEGLLRAYRSFHRFDPDTSFEKWMFRIIHNLYCDEWRKRSRRRIEYLDSPLNFEDGRLNRQIADWQYDPVQMLESQDFQRKLQEYINTLPPEYRTTLILCDIHGLSYDEISKTLRISPGTVRSRIHRARKLLQKQLKSYLAG